MIYFVQKADGTGPIKIGKANCTNFRLKTIQSHCPDKMKLLCTIDGSFQEERYLHLKLLSSKAHGEWFHPTDEVLQAVDDAKSCKKLMGFVVEDRTVSMAEMYNSGKTLQQIGDVYGMTRERVRQIFRRDGVKSLGLRKKEQTA